MKRFFTSLCYVQNDKRLSFRVYRGIFFLFILLITACEKVVDFPVDETGRIYIDAIVGQKDGGRINLAVSHPALGSEDASAEDITLHLKADGEPVSLVRDMDYVPESEGMVSYLVEGSFRPGQKLELEAGSPTLPSAKALTTVPASLQDVKLTYKKVNTYKNRDPEQMMGNLITLLEFNMAMDEKPGTDIYFGVQVCKRAVYDTVGTVPDHTWEQYEKKSGIVEYDDLYIDAAYTEGSAISSAVKETLLHRKRDSGRYRYEAEIVRLHHTQTLFAAREIDDAHGTFRAILAFDREQAHSLGIVSLPKQFTNRYIRTARIMSRPSIFTGKERKRGEKKNKRKKSHFPSLRLSADRKHRTYGIQPALVAAEIHTRAVGARISFAADVECSFHPCIHLWTINTLGPQGLNFD